MGFNRRDQAVLVHMQEAKRRQEELREVLDFYEKLFSLQFAFKSRLADGPLGKSLGAREIRSAFLAEGTPQIAFEDLRMEASPFLELYGPIAELLSGYMADPRGLEGSPSPGRILQYAREIFEHRTPLVGPEQPTDLARTTAGLILAPYLQLACDTLMPGIELARWDHGHCPICGGVPSLAALDLQSGARTLLCSRCNGEWGFRRIGCPFCRRSDPQTYFPSEDERYRLYVCEGCNRYLKTVTVREKGEEVSLPVECIVTVPMDIAARGKGYKIT